MSMHVCTCVRVRVHVRVNECRHNIQSYCWVNAVQLRAQHNLISSIEVSQPSSPRAFMSSVAVSSLFLSLSLVFSRVLSLSPCRMWSLSLSFSLSLSLSLSFSFPLSRPVSLPTPPSSLYIQESFYPSILAYVHIFVHTFIRTYI